MTTWLGRCSVLYCRVSVILSWGDQLAGDNELLSCRVVRFGGSGFVLGDDDVVDVAGQIRVSVTIALYYHLDVGDGIAGDGVACL